MIFRHWWGSSEIQSERNVDWIFFSLLVFSDHRWPQVVMKCLSILKLFPTPSVHCTLWRRLTIQPCAAKPFSFKRAFQSTKRMSNQIILCQFYFSCFISLRLNVITNGRGFETKRKNSIKIWRKNKNKLFDLKSPASLIESLIEKCKSSMQLG